VNSPYVWTENDWIERGLVCVAKCGNGKRSGVGQFRTSCETLRTRAPVDDLRLIDLIAGVVGGGQARGVANRAVDVDRFSAAAADHVMVVVSYPVLIKGRRPGGLDAPDEAIFGQDAEGVVDRLSRNRSNPRSNVPADVVRRAVGTTRYRTHDSQSLGRHLDTVFAQEICRILKHRATIRQYLDTVNN
jgi:hypothetical protein